MSMIDVSNKDEIIRIAIAEGVIKLSKETIRLLLENNRKMEKGDVKETARIAGILAAKKVPELLPHCHPIRITKISVDLRIEGEYVKARCTVKAVDRTGVEMEALTGVSVALLTVWDMVKKYEKDEQGLYPHTEITGIRVIDKLKVTPDKA